MFLANKFCSLSAFFFLFSLSETYNQVLSFSHKPLKSVHFLKRVSPLHFSGDIGVDLYDAQLTVSQFIESQLSTASPTSIAFLYGAGLLTAFSPCSISLLPLTLTYLGGSEATKSSSQSIDDTSDDVKEKESKKQRKVLTRSSLYASGLATTLTLFGLSAALLGNVFGNSGVIGDASALLSSVLFLSMGLYLLGLINIDFPSIEAKFKGNSNSEDNEGLLSSGSAQAFFFGATSALVASPCSSPVLTSLLAFVAASGDATIGAIFLFTYSLGYATPVVLAGALSSSAVGIYV
jgi:cytochrome c biogenesis protein CcdA